jgi:UDP-galactopyranose mutase
VKKKILIVGGGMAGCASAHVLSKFKDFEVTLIDKLPFLGAGVRTFLYAGHPYTFGPRHVLTQNLEVYSFLNKINPLRKMDMTYLSFVEGDNQFYNFPMHYDDLKKMPDRKKIKRELKNRNLVKIQNSKNLEEYWINSVGRILYKKLVDKYNKKMWQVDNNKLIDTFGWSPKGATIKTGNKKAWQTSITAYPIKSNGYNDFFDKVFKIKNINIKLNANFEIHNLNKKSFYINNKIKKFDIVINTISPDFYFKKYRDSLRYIGRDFHKIVMPTENVLPKNVSFLYYPNDEMFTRIVEFKKMTLHKSKTSLLGLEIPSKNGKHYPIPFKSEIKKAFNFIDDFPKWFFSIGRAGTYRYAVDIDDCIEQAIEIGKIINNDDYSSPLPLKKWQELN